MKSKGKTGATVRTSKVAKPRKRAAKRSAGSARLRAAAELRLANKRIRELVRTRNATAEILSLVSSSLADAQPVYEAIVEHARTLCGATFSAVILVVGQRLSHVASRGLGDDAAASLRVTFPQALGRDTAAGRAILERRVVNIDNAQRDSEYSHLLAQGLGIRTLLGVPMLHDGAAIGAIIVWRKVARPFSPEQIALLRGFADQAVIAINNARLFGDLQMRNKDLTEALEQQTATSEILRVISRSPTEAQPVFDTIAAAALKLCGGSSATVARVEGAQADIVALASWNSPAADSIRRSFPRAVGRDTAVTRAIYARSVVDIADVLVDPEYAIKEAALAGGYRSALAVPLMRNGAPIGSIAVVRPEPGAFPEKQIALLETFADQAVIAIENARLFDELQKRNNELRVALEQQTATSEVLKVIGRSTFNLEPVFATLAENAVRLCAAERGLIWRFDGERLRFAVGHNVSPELTEFFRGHPIAPGRNTVSGRAMVERRTVHIDVGTDPEYDYGGPAVDPYRSALGVPMIKGDEVLGVIVIYRHEVRPFSDDQIALVETFADQAVIAIENVRLFNELESRNRELTEALEQQMATSEILRVISSSPTDVQPVFDTIAAAALKLCSASSALVTTFDGELVQLGALAKLRPEGADGIRNAFPRPPSRETGATRAILTGSTVEIPDVLHDPDYATSVQALAGDFRSILAIPLVRNASPIGAISVGGPEAGPFPNKQKVLLQTFADQAVIAIENVRLFNELDARNRELTEALEQQTATSDILRTISRSQTDVQPVFETIAASVVKLCRAQFANVFTYDGSLIHLAAYVNDDSRYAERVRGFYPRPVGRDTAVCRAVGTGRPCMIPDVLEDPEYRIPADSSAGGFRSVLAVPLLRDGKPIGGIALGRPEPGLFSDSQLALLQTFADQAVIAIENARLFNELEVRNRDLTEALDQQTATSEILQVISSSHTDLQPVFDTIVRNAARLCDGMFANALRFDGELLHFLATSNTEPEFLEHMRTRYPRRPDTSQIGGRVILSRSVVVMEDALADPDYDRPVAVAGNWRRMLGVPMLREGVPLGVILVGWTDPGPVAKLHTELLKTFADQAAIAIENVRLFNELESRNRDLTEALEQQTATSEILRVISKSPRDVQPVFDTIAAAAMKLCSASSGTLVTFDGELVHLGAVAVANPEMAGAIRSLYPRPPSGDTTSARVVLTRGAVMIPDTSLDPDIMFKDVVGAAGFRSTMGVPLLRDGNAIGAITVGKPTAGPFSENQTALLRTFADQAVIAIENVRLFTELESRTTELARSVQELKALGEVGQAVSSTLDLEAVLRTIVARARSLAGMDGGAIYEYDEAREQFYLRATDNLVDDIVDMLRAAPIPKGEGVLGQLAVAREPVQISDIRDARIYRSRVREILIRLGYRSLLAVPLLREDHLLGGLVVNRAAVGEFSPQIIALLQTFATQSALAIQNARLYRELESKSRELEAASRHKSEFLANMSHELRTPLNAIIGFSEVLAERMFGDINEKQSEYLRDILESGQHLLSLINDILDLSKIEAGRMELEPSEFDLASAIENTLILVRERAVRRGIDLTHSIDARLKTIHADERKVKQVLLNLLSNALKFTPEGGRVNVRAGVRDGVAEISVADTGTGIAPEDHAAVFEEFRQVGASAKKVEGTGLGLAISRKFIELHGGTMSLQSELGRGSTFTFTLPLRAA